jgi:hypothetical protein
MSNPRITIKNDMSKVDVLEGLWKCSSPASFFKTIPNGDDVRKKQESAAWQDKEAIEKNLQRNSYIDYFGGRCIKTDMSKYPELDLSSYKKQCEIEMPIEEIFKRCLSKT